MSVWQQCLVVLASMAVAPVSGQSGAAQACPERIPANEIGRIKNTTAGVTITYCNKQTFAAAAGRRLYEGDTLTTARRARVGVTMADNTRMAIGPNSEVEFTEYGYDRARRTGRSTTSIRRGSVGIDSGNITRTGRDRMRVRTPTSTLGVRGTTFVVEVEG